MNLQLLELINKFEQQDFESKGSSADYNHSLSFDTLIEQLKKDPIRVNVETLLSDLTQLQNEGFIHIGLSDLNDDPTGITVTFAGHKAIIDFNVNKHVQNRIKELEGK